MAEKVREMIRWACCTHLPNGKRVHINLQHVVAVTRLVHEGEPATRILLVSGNELWVSEEPAEFLSGIMR